MIKFNIITKYVKETNTVNIKKHYKIVKYLYNWSIKVNCKLKVKLVRTSLNCKSVKK